MHKGLTLNELDTFLADIVSTAVPLARELLFFDCIEFVRKLCTQEITACTDYQRNVPFSKIVEKACQWNSTGCIYLCMFSLCNRSMYTELNCSMHIEVSLCT